MTLPLAAGPSAYWYATRGAGVVALLLLTASLVMGIVDLSRWQSERWPRFTVDGVHRTVSLLAVGVVAVHVLTTALDTFTQISLRDAVLPFASSYRPIWVGAGALAFDLLLALSLTSVLRRHIGHRTWRLVHWSAYACWPLALIHGLGAGTDAKVAWMLAISGGCLFLVLAAVSWRIAASWPRGDNRRALAGSAVGVGLIALFVWALQGPLASNWASRSGTPATILSSFSAPSQTTADGGATAVAGAGTQLQFPFSAQLTGRALQRSGGSGLVDVDIRAAMRGSTSGTLEIQILGQPLAGGGVSMSSSDVSLGPPGQPLLYRGQVAALNGSQILATVTNGQDAGRLRVRLSIGGPNQRVSGVITAAKA